MVLSDVCQSLCLTSVRRLSVAYIGPKSRRERPRKTKIGAEVAHVTRDSDTTFKVKRSRSQGAGHIVTAPAQLVTLRMMLKFKRYLPRACNHQSSFNIVIPRPHEVVA